MSTTTLGPRPADRIIAPDQTFTTVGRDVTEIAFEHEGGLRWWIAFAASLALVGVLAAACSGCSSRASAYGATTSPSPGRSTSSATIGGSAWPAAG